MESCGTFCKLLPELCNYHEVCSRSIRTHTTQRHSCKQDPEVVSCAELVIWVFTVSEYRFYYFWKVFPNKYKQLWTAALHYSDRLRRSLMQLLPRATNIYTVKIAESFTSFRSWKVNQCKGSDGAELYGSKRNAETCVSDKEEDLIEKEQIKMWSCARRGDCS